MRVSVFVLAVFLVCQVRGFEYNFWNPSNLIYSFVNKTRELRDVVRSKWDSVRNKGREMMDYYKDKVDDDKIDEDADEVDQEYLPDPDADLTTPQIVAKYGYRSESHTVKTEDGYLLMLHRIVPDNLGRPILLHHGLLGSSADWILTGRENALAYALVDSGYDVWLGNARGNTYSRAHTNLSTSDPQFWNFSWHEIGYYDLPAYIDYINRVRGIRNDLLYIGHSMGTTSLFVLLSTRPEYNERMRAAYALAPVAYMSAVKSPGVRVLAPIAHNIQAVAKIFGTNEFFPQNRVMRWFAKHSPRKYSAIWEKVLYVICGFNKQEFNETFLPVVQGHIPAGTAIKSLVHYAQEIRAKGRFQPFDSSTEYPIERITLPMALFSARHDWLAGETDVERLYEQLPNTFAHEIITKDTFNHLDYLIGVDAPTMVYPRLIELIKKCDSL